MSILTHSLRFKTLTGLNKLVADIINVFDTKKIEYDIECDGSVDSVGDRLANRHFINFTVNKKNYILDGIFDQSYFDDEEVEYLVVAIYDDNGNYLENTTLESIL